MDAIISTLQRYLIQSGAITTIVTGVSAICVRQCIFNLGSTPLINYTGSNNALEFSLDRSSLCHKQALYGISCSGVSTIMSSALSLILDLGSYRLNSRDALRETKLDPEDPGRPLELSGLKIHVQTTRQVDHDGITQQV